MKCFENKKRLKMVNPRFNMLPKRFSGLGTGRRGRGLDHFYFSINFVFPRHRPPRPNLFARRTAASRILIDARVIIALNRIGTLYAWRRPHSGSTKGYFKRINNALLSRFSSGLYFTSHLRESRGIPRRPLSTVGFDRRIWKFKLS